LTELADGNQNILAGNGYNQTETFKSGQLLIKHGNKQVEGNQK
jgi:hypothetical protein